MGTKKSLADLLRNHINGKLAENFDYSLASNRKQDILSFIEKNKVELDKKQQNINSIRPSHTRHLEECMKNKGLDPKSLGRSTRKPKFSGDLNPVITPEPQAGAVDTTKPTQGAPIQGQAGVIQTTAPDGTVIVQPQIQMFDEESVSATLSAIFLMFRFAYPDLELLTEDEKKSLGKVWLPAFNKYMTENWAIIGVPLFATAGIFLPKLVEARKRKQIRNSKGEAQAKQEETDSKLKERAEQIKKETEEKIKKSQTPENQIDPEQPNAPPPEIGRVSTEIILPKKENDESRETRS